MSAIKITARIIVAAAAALGFVSSCGELLGDFEVTVEKNLPGPDAGELPPPPICEAGMTACAGPALQLCTDDGTGWATLEICATVDLCETSDNSTVSDCLKPTCAADQMSCDGNLLRACNTMRTGWEPFDTCESAAHCEAGKKQCLPAPCEPGDRRCNVGNLERCNDARTAWEPLEACETNELCEATLAPPAVVGEVFSVNQLPPPAPLVNDEGPISCLKPVCLPKEVQCDLNRLIVCTPGQTALTFFEDCATPKLCDASIAYTGARGSPRCVRAVCALGEHRCTDSGVLELCNADRDGYDSIEACIGSPFCNAVAADNGQPGCEDAPCEAGEMQCNGAQIQVCTDDRTKFVPFGAPCETRGLCNDDNGRAAFCQAPVCQRGAFSGSEFRCDGATLLRCNDQHTGFDTLNTCATPGLCNAALAFAGCQQPVCSPGETRCNGNFAQRCNAQRTGFDNVEQCSAGTCDSSIGRCADPCVVGSARCNAQGNLEECRDLLVGREVTARCGSPQLCDAGARTCRTPPQGCTADGVRRCRQQGQATVLEECTDGRSRFATLDTCDGGEVCDPNDTRCDVCAQGSQPICEGNNLATCSANGQTEANTPCNNGCQTITTGADRCLNCRPGSVACEGFQLVVCRQRNGTEVLDRENCDTNALCQQTIQNCTGEGCRCTASVCDPGERQCNGGQPEICNAGRTAFQPDGGTCGQGNCNSQTGRCFACAVGDVSCVNGSLFGCAADRSGFTTAIGTQRCLQDNIGDRLQSCNGNQLIDSRCPGGSPICVAGSGCQECNPRAPFDSECTTVGGQPARTVCFSGDIESEACTGDDDCVDAVCAGAGSCDTRSSNRGTACRRGGNAGVCDGAPDPSCVECLQNPASGNCDDLNACTTDSCSGTTCAHTNNTERCTVNGAPGICSGGTCARVICTPNTEFRCTGATRERCNANGTGFVFEETCPSAALCSAMGCGTACTPADCNGVDRATCSPRVCQGNSCVVQAPPPCQQRLCIAGQCEQCVNEDDCPRGLVCSQGNDCVPPPPACAAGETRCSEGTVFEKCNAGRTGFDSENCALAGDVCTLDGCRECVANSDCDSGEICQNNNTCAQAPPPPCIPAACPFQRCNPDNTCAICEDGARDCRQPDPSTCMRAVCTDDGVRCEQEPNEGAPCQNGGTCTADANCQQPEPFCGDRVCDLLELLNCEEDCGIGVLP